jgi:hypothetical protein
MELEGIVHSGAIILDDATALPEGARVRIAVLANGAPKAFGEHFARFKGAIKDLPEDLADQHEHYRLGTPRR